MNFKHYNLQDVTNPISEQVVKIDYLIFHLDYLMNSSPYSFGLSQANIKLKEARTILLNIVTSQRSQREEYVQKHNSEVLARNPTTKSQRENQTISVVCCSHIIEDHENTADGFCTHEDCSCRGLMVEWIGPAAIDGMVLP